MNSKNDTSSSFWNNDQNINWFKTKPSSEYWKDFLVEIENKKIKKVLDLGCGAGRNTEMIWSLGFNVYGVDLHEDMVSTTMTRMKTLAPEINWSLRIVQTDMTSLPYMDGSFDVVLSNGVYHNVSSVEDLEIAIQESARVLSNNGFLCINIFTSKYIDHNTLEKESSNHLYTTKEGLDMILISSEELIAICDKYNLKLQENLTEYVSEVSTGKRSVARGVFKKS
ncbi:MAG: class I SAM-dependent methyltransferase [Candidatus Vogelbacteria bacterium]|nr:class I SAM-dependent methyltransferase [Candidatus Vogelbacteria bacterium]